MVTEPASTTPENLPSAEETLEPPVAAQEEENSAPGSQTPAAVTEPAAPEEKTSPGSTDSADASRAATVQIPSCSPVAGPENEPEKRQPEAAQEEASARAETNRKQAADALTHSDPPFREPSTQTEVQDACDKAPALAPAGESSADYAPRLISLTDNEDYPYHLEILEEFDKAFGRASIGAGQNGFAFRLHSLVREVHSIVSPLAKSKDLIFSWYISPGLPEVLEGDAPRLRGALSLLLQNAVQATTQGSVQLVVRKNPDGDSPADLLFTISDSGSAQRTDAGFFHAWELASRSGGSFAVDYSPTGGTLISFTVQFSLPSDEAALTLQTHSRLPLDEPDRGREPVLPGQSAESGAASELSMEQVLRQEGFLESPQEKSGSGRAADEASLPEKRHVPEVPVIVAAEMTTSNRRLLAHYLAEVPHEHLNAATNAQVLEWFRQRVLTLVIFDADMPEPDIIATIKDLRGQEHAACFPETPVLVLTSHEAQSRRMLEAGSTQTLCKPFSRKLFLQKVQAAAPALFTGEGLPEEVTGAGPLPASGAQPASPPADAAPAPAALAREAAMAPPPPATGEARAPEISSGDAPREEIEQTAAQAEDAGRIQTPFPAAEAKEQTEQQKAAHAAAEPQPGQSSIRPAPADPDDYGDPALAYLPTPARLFRQQEQTAESPAPFIPLTSGWDTLSLTTLGAGAGQGQDLLEAALQDAPQPQGSPVEVSLPNLRDVGRNPAETRPAGAKVSVVSGGHNKSAGARQQPDVARERQESSGKTPKKIVASVKTASAAEQQAASPASSGPSASKPRVRVTQDTGPLVESRSPGASPPAADHTGPGVAPAAQPQQKSALSPAPPVPPAAQEHAFSATYADEALNAQSKAAPSLEDKPEGVPPETAAELYPLPNMEGEYLDATILPLVPGVIFSLNDSLEVAVQGKEQGNTLLVQEAVSRLAGKAEHFGLHKLGKLARCVERAAEADDREAVETLMEDLEPITKRYAASLKECFDAFLGMER